MADTPAEVLDRISTVSGQAAELEDHEARLKHHSLDSYVKYHRYLASLDAAPTSSHVGFLTARVKPGGAQ